MVTTTTHTIVTYVVKRNGTNMKTRDEIITNMCYTWRHDFGLNKVEESLSSGMTDAERKFLWAQMAQLFDNDIAPNMEFK